MIKIAPSILSADYAYLGDAIKSVESEADWFHLDVMDGHFVPNITIGPPVVKSIRPITDVFFDCHLMITNPEKYLEPFRDAGANGCSVHIEVGDTAARIKQMKELGMKAGLAINPDTPFESFAEFLGDLDWILLMTVVPGFGGQSFISHVVPKIELTRKEIDNNNLSCEIQVDGGIDPKTAAIASKAGANIFVAGHAIFREPDSLIAAKGIRAAAAG